MKSTDRQINELARVMGVDPESIRIASRDWSAMMKHGVIVNIHIRRWRGVATLEEKDLGLPPDLEHNRDLLKLGSKALLPPKLAAKIQSMEVAARNYVRTRAIPTAWGYFVPVEAFEEFIAELRERQAAYMALGNLIADTYGDWTVALLEDYRREARVAMRRNKALDQSPANVARLISEIQFIEGYVDAIAGRIPDAETIRATYDFEIDLAYIPLPSMLAEDAVLAAEVKLQEAETFLQADITHQAALEKKRRLAEMNRQVVEDARKKKESLVRGFLADIATAMRQRTYEVFAQALQTTQTNGSFQARTVVALRNWIDQVRAWNLIEDQEIEAIIAPVAVQLQAPAEARSVGAITQVMDDIVQVTRLSMLQLGVRPRLDGKEMDEAVDLEAVSMARGRLGLKPLDADDLTKFAGPIKEGFKEL